MISHAYTEMRQGGRHVSSSTQFIHTERVLLFLYVLLDVSVPLMLFVCFLEANCVSQLLHSLSSAPLYPILLFSTYLCPSYIPSHFLSFPKLLSPLLPSPICLRVSLSFPLLFGFTPSPSCTFSLVHQPRCAAVSIFGISVCLTKSFRAGSLGTSQSWVSFARVREIVQAGVIGTRHLGKVCV